MNAKYPSLLRKHPFINYQIEFFFRKKKLIYLTNLYEINTQLSGYNRELLVDPKLNSLN